MRSFLQTATIRERDQNTKCKCASKRRRAIETDPIQGPVTLWKKRALQVCCLKMKVLEEFSVMSFSALLPVKQAAFTVKCKNLQQVNSSRGLLFYDHTFFFNL